MTNSTSVERISDREVVITRVINGPVGKVFQAWTRAELFRQWWVPEGAPIALKSCEMDVRVGGGYKLVFDYQGNEMPFFGKYTEVVQDSRLVWTNDEAGDEAAASGSLEGSRAQFEQLEEFVTHI